MWLSKEEIARKREQAQRLIELADRVRDNHYEEVKHKIALLVATELNLQRELCHRGPFKGIDGNPESLLFAELAWKALNVGKKWPKCSAEKCTHLANYPEHGKPQYCFLHCHLFEKVNEEKKSEDT